MIPASLIGNPFNIRENPFKNKKSIFYYVLGVILISLIGFLLVGEPIILRTVILGSLIGFLSWTIIYTIKERTIIFKSIPKYFIFDWKRIPFISIQIILAASIYLVWSGAGSDFWLAVGGVYFWIVSGFLRIINERSSFLVEENEKDIVVMLKVYSINRLSFFFIALIGLVSSKTFINEIFIFLSNLWLFLFFILSLVYFYLVTTNLIPYMTKSNDERNCVRIIQFISKASASKESIKQQFNLNDNKADYLLSNLEYTKYIKKPTRKYTLGSYKIFT